MKKLTVDKDKCIGCGACVAIDPDHFDFSDEGYSEVVKTDALDTAEVKNAAESCPTGAIQLSCDCDDDCECGCKDGKDCTCDGECK